MTTCPPNTIGVGEPAFATLSDNEVLPPNPTLCAFDKEEKRIQPSNILFTILLIYGNNINLSISKKCIICDGSQDISLSQFL
jgi:hypothetical protein